MISNAGMLIVISVPYAALMPPQPTNTTPTVIMKTPSQ